MKHANSTPFNNPNGGYQITFYASEVSPIASIYAYDQDHADQIIEFYMATVREIQPNVNFHYEISEFQEW